MKAQEKTAAERHRLRLYCLVITVAMLLVNLLSAYIRHQEAGLGCQPWPDCYAVIGEQIVVADSAEVAQKALSPGSLIKQTHRAVATVLVIAVLLLLQQSRKPRVMQGATAALPYLLLAMIILLSVIGPASYLKTLPIIALINLAGGLAMTAISWILYLQLGEQPVINAPGKLQKLWLWALLALGIQILLGIWVSGNFAGAACNSLLGCAASSEYQNPGNAAFWYFRELALDDNGRVVMDAGTLLIHISHRLFALIASALLLAACWQSRTLAVRESRTIAGLLLLQLVFGAVAVVTDLSLTMILLHNLNAALLLLAAIKIRHLMNQAH